MLSPIDAEMELKRVNFTRFVDDIRIFADSEQELRMNLYFLTQRLILRGFILIVTKLELLKVVTMHKNSCLRDLLFK